MNPLNRLRLLRDTLPANGSLVLNREALSELLGESEPVSTAVDTPADLTVEQVGERLGRRPGTVREWIRTGKLRAYPFNGKEYRVTPGALDEFVQAQREGKQEPARRQGKPVDLSRWRQVRDKAA